MNKFSFVRGSYLNNFEGQNYHLPFLTGYSSLFPLDDVVPFPLIKLPSIADIQTVSFLQKPIKFIANRTFGDAQILFGLERYIRHSDIVHVGDPHYYYSYQAAVLKARGEVKKLVSTWWETIPFNNESTAAKKRIKKYVISQGDMFICHSERAKQCMLKEGIAEGKITVIPLGVDIIRFKAKPYKTSSCFTILFVGRLVEEKGVMDLYEAFKQFIHVEKQAYLKIVGNGPLKSTLQSMIRKDGLQERVRIERVSYTEMPAVFREADVLCVPSKKTKTWEEQLGMVFIEAMASGLPIVSYHTGAISELVNGVGLLAGEGSVSQLVQSFKRLNSDAQLRTKLGKMGRERAEALFDAQKTARKIEALYRQLTQL